MSRGFFKQITSFRMLALAATVMPGAAMAAPERMVLPGQEVVVSFPLHSGTGTRAAGSVSALHVPDSVQLHSGLGDTKIGVFSASAGFGIKSREPVPVDDAAIERACAELRSKNPGLRFTCEANILFHATKVPNDPRYGELYGMGKIQAPEAWEVTTGSSGVLVAVVDTGVQYNHPDLSGNIALNTADTPGNGVDDDGNGYVDDYYGYNAVTGGSDPMDDNGHGSHCAGTIGAKGDDGNGITGVNWNVGIIPVKVLDKDGSGTLADIASGIRYSIARGARIVSLSLGGPSNSDTLEAAISEGRSKNVLFVVAAGNESSDNDVIPSYPASSTSDAVLAVAATDSNDNLASFSNTGPTSVDVAAPGVDILSTVPTGSYDFYSGTSMATPMTAGVAALILAANPNLSFQDVKSLIMNTVDTQPGLAGLILTGGRVNANKAVAAAAGTTPTTPAPDPTTPDPGTVDPGDPGDPGEEEAYYLYGEYKKQKRNKKGTVTAYIYDSEDNGVPGETLYLVCKGRVRATAVSNSQGVARMRINRPKRPMTCYLEDDYEEYSDEFMVN